MERKIFWAGPNVDFGLCKKTYPHEPHMYNGFVCGGVEGEACVNGCTVRLHIKPVKRDNLAGLIVEYVQPDCRVDIACEGLFIWLMENEE